MHRVARVVGSFAIVLVAYWAYALVAVPLIEPPADARRGDGISDAEREGVRGRMNAEVAELVGLFPPDAWELREPKILESEQFRLLMRDYKNLGDGRVEICPCTMILTPDGPPETEELRRRHPVILEAPEGALLEFDAPFDLRRMRIGRLIGGRLMGPITIRSAGQRPGPEDDLWIATRDVQLTEQNVITPNAVEFRYGPHYGRGSQMRMKLLSGEGPSGSNGGQPSIGGIELFELRRVERLHLELGNLDLGGLASDATATTPRPEGGPEAKATSAATSAATVGAVAADVGQSPARAATELPIEVTCRGPFRFDAVGKVATFEDRVDVLRLNPNGPSDQLNCELLSIFFSDVAEPATGDADTDAHAIADAASDGPAGSPKLRPTRLEARGDPVVVVAPSQQLQGRGQRLEYDLATRRITLDGSQEVMLQQTPNEIRARSLEYQPAEKGRLGQITARGPGWLRGQMDQRPEQQIEARWNDQLQVRPSDGNQVISLTGGAGLTFRGMEQLNAEEIHFWLLETKPQTPGERWALRPDRMLARGAVAMRSEAMSGAIEQLEVWFEPGTADGVASATPATTVPGGSGPAPSSLGAGGGLVPGVAASEQPAPDPTVRRQHMQITGRLLRARMVLEKSGRTSLSEVIVEDEVEFVETQTEQPGDRPLLVRGDRLHVVDADKPHAAVTVAGRPAHFEGRGLALTGQAINLNRGTNRLWIDTPGRMDVVMDRDLEGRPLGNPGTMQIEWQDSMVFDGRTARFEDSVTVTAPQRHLQTETLDVRLRQAIDFSAGKIEPDARIEQILCRGGTFMEGLSFDERNPAMQTSHERMQVGELAINLDTGSLTAAGPGWLTSVRRGTADPAGGRSGGLLSRTAYAGADAAEPLNGLHVRFQGSISGNVLPDRREMTFCDGVKTAYAPVDSWAAVPDVNEPASLGPRGMVLNCGRLKVYEMPTPEADGRSVEMVADGNPVVEGETFTAWAIRMSYAEAKDLLILEGDGRTDARLFYQPQVGGPTSKHTARKIFYSPQTNRLRVEGARSLELDQLPSGN